MEWRVYAYRNDPPRVDFVARVFAEDALDALGYARSMVNGSCYALQVQRVDCKIVDEEEVTEKLAERSRGMAPAWTPVKFGSANDAEFRRKRREAKLKEKEMLYLLRRSMYDA